MGEPVGLPEAAGISVSGLPLDAWPAPGTTIGEADGLPAIGLPEGAATGNDIGLPCDSADG